MSTISSIEAYPNSPAHKGSDKGPSLSKLGIFVGFDWIWKSNNIFNKSCQLSDKTLHGPFWLCHVWGKVMFLSTVQYQTDFYQYYFTIRDIHKNIPWEIWHKLALHLWHFVLHHIATKLYDIPHTTIKKSKYIYKKIFVYIRLLRQSKCRAIIND